MKRRILAFAVIHVVLSVVVAPTAIANPDATRLGKVGAFAGTIAVGKSVSGLCTANNHSYFPSGAGLGLPELKRAKTVHWKLDTTILAMPGGVGSFEACGRLVPGISVGRAAIGAACGVMSAQDGFGTIETGLIFTDTTGLTDIGWDLALGGVIPWSARTDSGGLVRGMLFATGADSCISKAPGDKPASGPGSGATSFAVVGVFGYIQ